VAFASPKGFTEVQITHDRFPSPEIRDKHNYGWSGCLDKLEKQFSPASGGSAPTCSETGTFCWNELLAIAPGGAGKFYAQLFGWQTEAMAGGMPYTLFKQNGKSVGGLMARPHEQAPPHWLAYVRVDNVDSSARRAGELGAKLLMPPTDIPTVGRIAIFADPEGAPLGLFQPVQG
jgi:uncharacterized protein